MIKPSSCEPCPLFAISNGWILSEGQGTNGVVILGEAGGYHEYLDNLPFRPQAQSGSKLEEVFKIVSRETGQPCSRDQFVLYNVVNCNPPGDKLVGMGYEQEAISCCASNVDRVVGGFHTDKVKTILALGNIPLKFLTGVSGIAEEKQSVSYLRGYVLESKYGLVVPSYHPSYVRRGNGHLTPILVEDMKKALNVARGVYTNYSSYKGYTPPNYQVAPSLDEAWSFYYKVKDGSRLVLACDIETDQSAEVDEDERDDLESTVITLVQFSYEMCTGIALPCSGDYISIIEALLALPNVKAGHNWWNFDSPRLRAKGFRVNGNIHDTMWMFKHWHPKLPRGLQSVASLFGFPFPWKHLYGANFQFYGCADVDAVQWILHHLPKLMKERGVWRGYYEHVYQVNPILDRASVGGIPVNDNNRVALEKDFKARRETIHRELQRVVPEEIRNIRPKRKDKETGEVDYGYIREPKIVGIEFENYQRLSEELRLQDKRVVSFEEFLWRKHNLTLAEFERVDRDTGERTKLERWAIVEEFKASSQQLIRYLEWKQRGIREEVERLREQRKGLSRAEGVVLTAQIRELEELAKDYEVPTNLKTKRPTTSHKEIEEMFFKTGDEVLEMVSKVRSYDTNINNFIPNWKPSNGRVHPTYGYTAPQGQINSWRPNSQNVSKHTEFGNEFRRIIEAPPGYCFIEADKKSFHVATMGYCANDRDYIRFSQIDPHSILGSYIDPSIIGCSISLKWSDSDIKKAASEFKRRCKEHKAKDPEHNIDVRQELAKPTVLGNQLGLGAKKLQRQNRRFIHSIGEAERLQAILNNLFPKEEAYQKWVKEEAYIKKFLINEYGRIQYFYDVFTFSWSDKSRQWIRKEGEGARHPIAFRVQGTAFGMITDELLECERQGLCEEHNFITTIHDSLMFMPEISKRDKCIESVVKIMNQPAKKLVNEATGLEGLRVGVEVSVGRNWKGYDKESNDEGMQEIKLWIQLL